MGVTSTTASRSSLLDSEVLTFTSHVNEDDDVAALNKEFKAIDVNSIVVVAVISLVLGLGILIFSWGYYSPRQSELSREVQRWCSGCLLTAIGVWSLVYFRVLTKEHRTWRKYMRGSIASSRKIAQSLGADKVPVLTKEHVEKRVQVDAALKDKLDTRRKPWDQNESDSIAILLFQDLFREPVIMSLISERGLVTSADISAALQQMESDSIKPIQDGWL